MQQPHCVPSMVNSDSLEMDEAPFPTAFLMSFSVTAWQTQIYIFSNSLARLKNLILLQVILIILYSDKLVK